MMGAGWWLFSRGAGGSGVIIADDLTGVGVANDPALIVTGGMMVAGGGLMAIGGAWQWMCGD
jgi:hypothetical protein